MESISTDKMYRTLISRYGLKGILEYYVRKADRALVTAQQLAESGNSVGAVAQLGAAKESVDAIKGIVLHSDNSKDIEALEKELSK